MSRARERVAHVAGNDIEAIVDDAGRALVFDGFQMRDPERTRAHAKAMLRAAGRAEQLAREGRDESGVDVTRRRRAG